jgi:hypothetical protein
MKKLFTLVAMAFMALTVNAQAVVAEIDWTDTDQTPFWYSTDYAAVTVEKGTGLIIDCSSDGTTNYWEPQVPMMQHIESVTEGGQYLVKFSFNSPVAGELRLDFGSWDGTGATLAKVFEVAAGDQEMEIEMLDYPTECTDAFIFYQCGKLPGRHIVKKVEVIDLEEEEGGGAVVAEIDWTDTDQTPFWYSTDYAAVTVEKGTGLIIDCSSDGTTNYWEPQVPMMQHIESVTEGGQYLVKFSFNSPVAGELRLDFGSWDGTGATLAKVFEVAAGDQEMEIEMLDYPTECTDAFIFYQCGKLPGRHIVKKVQVIDLEGDPNDPTGITNVKEKKVMNNVRHSLSGQQVDENYNGIIIMNGKKFMQYHK